MIKYEFEKRECRSAAYDQDQLIGVCEYTIESGKWYIMHTYVESQYQGQGIARKLVELVVSEAKKENIQVVPICSYAVKLLNN